VAASRQGGQVDRQGRLSFDVRRSPFCQTDELPATRASLRSSRQLRSAGKRGDVITGNGENFH